MKQSKFTSIYKTVNYLGILCLVLLTSCDSSNITNSAVESHQAKFQNIGSWNGPYAYFGSTITTEHSVIQSYGGDIYFTRTGANQIYIGNNTIYLTSSRAPAGFRKPSCQQAFIVYRTSGGSAIYWTKADGYGGTPPNYQIPGSTSTGPTVVKVGNEIVVFHKGNNNNKIYERKASFTGCYDNISSWTNTQISGTNTDTTPSATVFNNRVYLFYKGPSSTTIYYRYRSTGGSSWSSEYHLDTSESRTPSTPTVRTIDNKLFLVYRGEDNKIYYRTMDTNGNWTSQTSTSSSARTSSAPDIALVDQSWLDISYRDQSTNRPLYIRANY